jgi:phosphatidylinositol 4-kinase
MEALTELCDLVARNPTQFPEKLAWMCNRCPQPDSLSSGSPRVSRSQLNAVLAVARFLSKCSDSSDTRPKSVVLEFLHSVPSSFTQSFWPQSFTTESIASFFAAFLSYVAEAAELSSDFAADIAAFSGDVVLFAIAQNSAISRVFLTALSQNFLPILPSDADRFVTCLLDQLSIPVLVPSTPREQVPAANSETSSAQSSPLSVNHYQQNESEASPGNEASHVSGSTSSSRVGDEVTSATSSRGSIVMNGGSILWKSGSGVDQLGVNLGLNDGGGTMYRQQVTSFEEESVESLEKQEIAFKLIAHILDKVQIDSRLLEQVRLIVKKQLQSLSVFLKVRRFWVLPFLQHLKFAIFLICRSVGS